jgi:MFS family permease
MQFLDDGSTTRRRLPPWLVVAFAMFALAWGGNQFTPLLTLYRRVDSYSLTTVDLLLAAYIGGLSPALLGGSLLRSRLGAQHTMLIALGCSIAGSGALIGESVPSLALGRVLTGFGLGIAMAVGTSWVVEATTLSGLDRAIGAKRAALALTAGLGLGAGVAGLLASWVPAPTTLPYLVHLMVAFVALALLSTYSSNQDPWRGTTLPRRPSELESLKSPRFRRLILPVGPWVFGVAAISYVVVPSSLTSVLGGSILPYTTALALLTLTVGFVSQELARRLNARTLPLALPVGMAITTTGLVIASVSVAWSSPMLGLLASLILGASYGIVLLGGLLETQRSSFDRDLATMTGLYYALAYLGFLFPAILATVSKMIDTPVALSALAALALVTTLSITRQNRKLHRDQHLDLADEGPLVPRL